MPKVSVDWIFEHSLKAAVIVIGGAILVRAAHAVIARLERRLGHGHSERDLEWQRRASTLGGILSRLVTVTVWFVAALMLLRELSIDVLPILTGAGIAGLAIGFGAQNLVRDVISGFFLILEDQVRVGDMARINGVTGVIEQVNLRTIVIRDGEGAVHVVPNGTVNSLANLSKQFSNAIVDLRIAYSENPDKVFAVMQDAGRSMQEDKEWASLLLSPIDVVGVESLADGYALVRAKFKTQPLNHGAVANELRRRLMTMMTARGITPYVPPAVAGRPEGRPLPKSAVEDSL
jgi:small conductance mechanosensitive channel